MGHVDAVQDLRNREVHVVHGLEGRVVQRVERDGHPLETGVFERLCLGVQRGSVRGQRNVNITAVRPLERGEHPHKLLKPLAQQRFATGEADLLDPVCHGDPGEPGHLLKGQQLGSPQEREVFAEDLLRHAVNAPEVAPIGDRNTKIPQWTVPDVSYQTGRGFEFNRDIREVTEKVRPRFEPTVVPSNHHSV